MSAVPVAPAVTPVAVLLVVQQLAARLDALRAEAAGYGYWTGYQDATAARPYANAWRGEVDGPVVDVEVRRG